MTGRELYEIYCDACSKLSPSVTKHEALPAYGFLGLEIRGMWERTAANVTKQFGVKS